MGEFSYQRWSKGLTRTTWRVSAMKSLKSAWDGIDEIAARCDTFTADVKEIKCPRNCRRCPIESFNRGLSKIVTDSKRDCMGLCLKCMLANPNAGNLMEFRTPCSHVVGEKTFGMHPARFGGK